MESQRNNYYVIFLCSVIFVSSCSRPESSGISSTEGDVFSEPVQISIKPKVIKTSDHKGYDWKITAVAEYELNGLVRGVKSYGRDWKSYFAPLDLCVTWGDLNKKKVEKYITYSQSGRWYYFRYKAGCPVDKNYIEKHASNNHILPGNGNILEAVKTAKRGRKIKVKGYLVNLYGTKGKGEAWYRWNSSLSRGDRGDASCELFYVNCVVIDNEIYK